MELARKVRKAHRARKVPLVVAVTELGRKALLVHKARRAFKGLPVHRASKGRKVLLGHRVYRAQ